MNLSIKRLLPFFIVLIFSLGVFFRIYNLAWGSPYFFHPDERNIAQSVSQLKFPDQLNPHFFAYGSLPIYGIYGGGIFMNIVEKLTNPHSLIIFNQVSFETAIISSRIYSVVFSLLILFLLYKTAQKLHSKWTSLISYVLAALSVGLIQYAHFGTFEMWLSFFSLLLFHSAMLYVQSKKGYYLFLLSTVLGVLLAIKVSSIFLVPIVGIAIGIVAFKRKGAKIHKRIFHFLILSCLSGFVALGVFILSSPYVLLDTNSFISSLTYEANVATGALPVFYTSGFTNSIPILFQFLKVYPFILNPFATILFIFAFIYLLIKIFQKKNITLFLIVFIFLILFLSQAFLYVKWIRYYIPTLPFIYLILGWFLSEITERIKTKTYRNYFLVFVLSSTILVGFIFSFSYFKTVLFPEDTRTAAAIWSSKNIATNSPILSEVYDLGIVPFNSYFPHITLFNFYDLETDTSLQGQVKEKINSNEYIILPSQRLYKNRLLYKEKFPRGYEFYDKLLYKNEYKFKKIYQTPCDVFCRILYLGDPIYSAEETANVFDRPKVIILKKTQ